MKEFARIIYWFNLTVSTGRCERHQSKSDFALYSAFGVVSADKRTSLQAIRPGIER
jgi:hypothetical protein